MRDAADARQAASAALQQDNVEDLGSFSVWQEHLRQETTWVWSL